MNDIGANKIMTSVKNESMYISSLEMFKKPWKHGYDIEEIYFYENQNVTSTKKYEMRDF